MLEMRAVHFIFVSHSPQKDYNVKVQHPIVNYVAHGTGILSKETAKYSVVSTLTLGLPQEEHILPCRVNLSQWKQHIKDVLHDDDLTNVQLDLPSDVHVDSVQKQALHWSTSDYLHSFSVLVYHLLQVEGLPHSHVIRPSGNPMCRLMPLPSYPPIPQAIVEATFELIWEYLIQLENIPSHQIPQASHEVANDIIEKVTHLRTTSSCSSTSHDQCSSKNQALLPPMWHKIDLSHESVQKSLNHLLVQRRSAMILCAQQDLMQAWVDVYCCHMQAPGEQAPLGELLDDCAWMCFQLLRRASQREFRATHWKGK
jgi:hypothetical protein